MILALRILASGKTSEVSSLEAMRRRMLKQVIALVWRSGRKGVRLACNMSKDGGHPVQLGRGPEGQVTLSVCLETEEPQRSEREIVCHGWSPEDGVEG